MNKFYSFETKRIKSIFYCVQRKNCDTSVFNDSWATERGELPLKYYDLEVNFGKELDNFLTFGFTAVIHKSVVKIFKAEKLK